MDNTKQISIYPEVLTSAPSGADGTIVRFPPIAISGERSSEFSEQFASLIGAAIQTIPQLQTGEAEVIVNAVFIPVFECRIKRVNR